MVSNVFFVRLRCMRDVFSLLHIMRSACKIGVDILLRILELKLVEIITLFMVNGANCRARA